MSSRTGLVADELFLARSEFGNIFAELLPGNFCKLQTLDGKEITQGLEVKVRLGTVWKSSLTELSGGQRSLIALSLIMSLLRFKPCVRIFFYFLQELVLMTLSLCSAPMYILDEIDAALDLSHSALPLSLALLRLSLTSTDSRILPAAENIGRLFRTRFKGSQFIVVSLKDGLFSNANGASRSCSFTRYTLTDAVRPHSPLPSPVPRRHVHRRAHEPAHVVGAVRQGEPRRRWAVERRWSAEQGSSSTRVARRGGRVSFAVVVVVVVVLLSFARPPRCTFALSLPLALRASLWNTTIITSS